MYEKLLRGAVENLWGFTICKKWREKRGKGKVYIEPFG
jgi:hypothetical protein